MNVNRLVLQIQIVQLLIKFQAQILANAAYLGKETQGMAIHGGRVFLNKQVFFVINFAL